MGPWRRLVRVVDWPVPFQGQDRERAVHANLNGPVPPTPNADIRRKKTHLQDALSRRGQETKCVRNFERLMATDGSQLTEQKLHPYVELAMKKSLGGFERFIFFASLIEFIIIILTIVRTLVLRSFSYKLIV